MFFSIAWLCLVFQGVQFSNKKRRKRYKKLGKVKVKPGWFILRSTCIRVGPLHAAKALWICPPKWSHVVTEFKVRLGQVLYNDHHPLQETIKKLKKHGQGFRFEMACFLCLA